MIGYLLHKLVLAIPTVIGASIIVFLGVRTVPGDPVQMMLGEVGATGQNLERLRAELGLDAPVTVQYAHFVTRSLRGDFGRSLQDGDTVLSDIRAAFPATAELAFAALALACVAGTAVGIVSALKQFSVFDNVLRVLVLIGVSMPIFWSGLLLLLTLGLSLKLFPLGGRLSDTIALHRVTGAYVLDSLVQGNWPALRDSALHLVLPAVTLATGPVAIIARMTRSAMLEVLRQEYIVTARSKGLDAKAVVLRHALKNALNPVVTVVGLQIGFLLGGTVVTETVFDWPGMGRLAVDSILYRDYPVVQGIVLLAVVIFVGINLLVDTLYAYLDPEIRLA